MSEVATALAGGGIRRVWGEPIGDLPCVAIGDPDVAVLLARADGRLHGGPAAASVGGRLTVWIRPPGGRPRRVDVDPDAEAVRAVLEALPADPAPSSVPEVPVDASVVVLAGPGVLHAGALEGLRALAGRGDLGVANTWGAKGVFSWDSPHHLGTCGLQARDFELLGLHAADVVLATGLDPDESPAARLAPARVVEVPPRALGELATRFARSGAPGVVNELYPRLAAVAQPGYVDERVPLHPARAAADLGAALPPGGLVAADPGRAGLWVARTFPTPGLAPGEPARVVVPARRAAGAAAALGLVAAVDGRAAVAVVDADDLASAAVTRTVLEVAALLDAPLVLVRWGAGRLSRASEHREELAARLDVTRRSGAVAATDVPVDWSATELLIEAAGPVVAWTDAA